MEKSQKEKKVIKKDTNGQKEEKKIKSANLSVSRIKLVENYCEQKGCTFSDVISMGIDLFFEALEHGNDRLVEGLDLDDPNKCILVPLQLFMSVTKTSFVQVQNLVKKKQLTMKTLTDKSNQSSSKTKYIVITEEHPKYYLVKMAMFENELSYIKGQINRLQEGF
jgi:hypothetical protein